MQVNLLLAWLAREDILNEIENRFSTLAPLILDYNYTVSEKQKLAVAQRIHQFYLQDKTISTDTTCNFIQVRWKQSKIRGTEILFEVYTVQIIQVEVFWIMEPCSFIQGCQCFRRICSLHSGSTLNIGASLSRVLLCAYDRNSIKQLRSCGNTVDWIQEVPSFMPVTH